MSKWSVVFALVLGAAVGATVGAMFDRLRDPGVITLYGAAVGMVVALLALTRLRQCQPFDRGSGER